MRIDFWDVDRFVGLWTAYWVADRYVYRATVASLLADFDLAFGTSFAPVGRD